MRRVLEVAADDVGIGFKDHRTGGHRGRYDLVHTRIVHALALGRFVSTQLYQVSPRDPVIFAITAVVLSAVALLAAWLPIRRAATVDPAQTLRAD